MKFDELDKRLRVFETAHDHCALPELWLVARLDGRSFTRLTKHQGQFEVPFDERFRDFMVETCAHLMDCGFQAIYAYTESDEISLLLSKNEAAFGRKLRKIVSVLSGEASAVFSLALGQKAVFDCRVSQLPSIALVVDYFRWRNEDAHRNALNAHCYWALRKVGKSEADAHGAILGLSVGEKNELLHSTAGLNFNGLPLWQRRGVGLYWEQVPKAGVNPKTGEATVAYRRSIRRDFNLPMRDEYSEFVRGLVASSEKEPN